MIIITGPIHSGKTTMLRELAIKLIVRGITLRGYLSESLRMDGHLYGYDLVTLPSMAAQPFLRLSKRQGGERIGRFTMLPSGLNEAQSLIIRHQGSEWLFIDEIGPLEMAGRGIWPALQSRFGQSSQFMVCVVRESLLAEFLSKTDPPEALTFDIRKTGAASELFEKLAGYPLGNNDA